jgi:hypothetical protein
MLLHSLSSVNCSMHGWGVAGNKTYAAAITKLLDPTGELFGQRVIAQGAERVDEMQVDQAKSFMQVRHLPPALCWRRLHGGH